MDVRDNEPLDLETRIADLLKNAESEDVLLPRDVAAFIASNFSNKKELQGALVRLVAKASFDGSDITVPYTQKVLANFIRRARNIR